MNKNPFGLLDVKDSQLIVIDVQSDFLDKLPAEEHEQVLRHVCWLVELAKWCRVPLVITAEQFEQMPLPDQLSKALPANTPVYNKMVFGLTDQEDIFQAVQENERKTAVLIGLETDVCVLHSALGLLEKGYRVAVVTDAVGTPPPNAKYALKRLQNAGVILLNTKGLFYEWTRTVENIERFHSEMPHMRQQLGIVF